jgi:hypothetical protein
VRFADILTTASAVANYTGDLDVAPSHLLDAIEILAGTKSMEDLGRPVSPLIPRPPGTVPGATPAVRELVQRWFAHTGSDVNVDLDAESLARLQQDLHDLA